MNKALAKIHAQLTFVGEEDGLVEGKAVGEAVGL